MSALARDTVWRIEADWLLVALGMPMSEDSAVAVATLDYELAWALARLHRKGVPAEYVAERWQTGVPLDADTLVASYREGGAA